MKPFAPYLAMLFVCALFPACEMPEETRPTIENMTPGAELPVPGRDAIWVITLRELEKSGYHLLEEGTSEASGDFETRWQMFLSPFRFEGRRVKILGRVEDVEGMPGYSRVRMAAWVQRNADIKDPINPAGAIWQDIEPDSGIVETLIYRIDSHFQ